MAGGAAHVSPPACISRRARWRSFRTSTKIAHTVHELVAQRVFGIACGYPDANDADRLADDPIQKLLLDRDPIDGTPLASQPTISRFEKHPGREPRDNPRVVVTNLRHRPQWLDETVYCARGDIENRLKELHHDLAIGRTSCSRFWASQLRVLLTAAYPGCTLPSAARITSGGSTQVVAPDRLSYIGGARRSRRLVSCPSCAS